MSEQAFELDYNLFERDGVIKVVAFEVVNGQTQTDYPFFEEQIGKAFEQAFAEVLGITDWTDLDLWFGNDEWKRLTSKVFAKVFGLPVKMFE